MARLLFATLDSMKGFWNKARPFVLSFGLHVFVLALLCLGFAQTQPRKAAGDEAPAVEATLVTAPSQPASRPAEPVQAQPKAQPSPPSPLPKPQPQPQPIASRPPLPKTAAEDKPNPIPAVQKPAAPPEPQPDIQPDPPQDESDLHREFLPTRTDATSADAQPAAEPPPDTSDPYAEMRRQRAEAERQYQIHEQNILQMQDQQAQRARVFMPVATVAPMFPVAGNGARNQHLPDPLSATLEFGVDGSWTPDGSLQLTTCSAGDLQPVDGDAFTTVWTDCQVRGGWRDASPFFDSP